MTTRAQNSDAINETLTTKQFAIFFREGRPRYAVRSEGPNRSTTLKEIRGGWEKHEECLEAWCIRHTDFQGFDDLSMFI